MKAKVLFKILSSFSFVVFSAIILGLVTGGYPAYTNEIAMVALIVAMIFSLSSISLKGISKGESLRHGIYSIALNFGLLSAIIIMISFLFKEELKLGFVIMASVPTAIAVIPITKILGGKMDHAFVSISLIYLSSLIFTPVFVLVFLGKNVDISRLIYDIILLIVVPLILSRFIRRVKIPDNASRSIANLCFFLLIFGIMGKNRSFLFCELGNILLLSIVLFFRTFVIGSLVFEIGRRMRISKDKLVLLSLFSSFKNEGIAILLCLSLLPKEISYIATIPCVLAIIFEMGWAGYLEIRAKR